MSDHVFDKSIIDLLVRETEPSQLTLAIDKKLSSIFDLDGRHENSDMRRSRHRSGEGFT